MEHFTPALLLEARYRLRGHLGRYLDPEELVNEVWLIALPRLWALRARDGRWTPVLVKFLSTTLLTRLRTIVRSHLRRWEKPPEAAAESPADDPLDQRAAPTAGIVSRVANRELSAKLHECIDSLGERDREILVLRGIEQLPNGRVAELLGRSKDAVSMQYRRALDRLRAALPCSVFSELDES